LLLEFFIKLFFKPKSSTSSANNIAEFITASSTCTKSEEDEYIELSKELFDKAAEY
jgi:hypothetical protein